MDTVGIGVRPATMVGILFISFGLVCLQPVAAGPTVTLFDTGVERRVLFDPTGACNHVLRFLGWSSGQLCNPSCAADDFAQRRAAQAFTIPEPTGGGTAWRITEIWVDGFVPDFVPKDGVPVVETLEFEIFFRTALDTPPTEICSLVTGEVPLPVAQDHPDGGAVQSLRIMSVDFELSAGDYWLTIWGSNSDPNTPSNFAWFTNADSGINNLDKGGNSYMWRAATYPDPGFEFYQLDDCILLPAGVTDPADLYNASFRIDGEEIVSCPWDCQAIPDGNVGINDFLDLLGTWNQIGVPCDFGAGPPGIGVEDFLDLLAHWGACPG